MKLRALGRLSMMLACFGGLALAGCHGGEAYQGEKRDVLASYSFGTLRADLSMKVQVLTAAAAAESALRSRGYVIRSSESSADSSRVEAQMAGDGDWDKMVVKSWVTEAGTALSVKREPFGDEASSRAVMDAVLARLGR